MNLTNNDKRLFEILDGEIDKTLSFGCIIKTTKGLRQISNVDLTRDDELRYELAGQLWGRKVIKATSILGHFPTHADVLRYLREIRKSGQCFMLAQDGCIYLDREDIVLFKLDLTKPIQNYTEEEKEELIKFLETIN